MPSHLELNPISHFTIGAVGVPGKRVFFLQGSRGADVVSLVIEKEQAVMLASSLEALLGELAKQDDPAGRESQEQIWFDSRLREPVDPLFRVGNMGLGYNEGLRRIVIVAYELVEEGEEPNIVSFWATRSQVQAVLPHIYDVVRAGRPICGNCGRPIDPEGHFCPNRNGHIK